jgi:hypothetical protein
MNESPTRRWLSLGMLRRVLSVGFLFACVGCAALWVLSQSKLQSAYWRSGQAYWSVASLAGQVEFTAIFNDRVNDREYPPQVNMLGCAFWIHLPDFARVVLPHWFVVVATGLLSWSCWPKTRWKMNILGLLSPRRLLRFRLRTLLALLTIIAVWLGYTAHVVRSRRVIVAQSDRYMIRVHDENGVSAESNSLSWMRRLMGDRAVDIILIRGKPSDEETNNLKALFPEASVIRGRPF